MRISDWSSDVCSSDLPTPTAATNAQSASVSLPPPSRGRAWCLPSNLPQRLPPRPEIAEQIGRHFPHLDFLRALGDAIAAVVAIDVLERRSEENTSELQSLMRISYAVFCLKQKTHTRYTI